MTANLPTNYKELPEYMNATRSGKTAMNRLYQAQQEAETLAREEKERTKAEAEFKAKQSQYDGEVSSLVVQLLALVESGKQKARTLSLKGWQFTKDLRERERPEFFETVRTCVDMQYVEEDGKTKVHLKVDTTEADEGLFCYSQADYVVFGNGTRVQYQAMTECLQSLLSSLSSVVEDVEDKLKEVAREEDAVRNRNAMRDEMRKTLPSDMAALLTPNE